MSPIAADLLSLLRSRAGLRRRLEIEYYRECFAELFPTLPAAELRSRLAAACEELALDGEVRLPRSSHRYDRASPGLLPAWLELPSSTRLPAALPCDPSTFPWAPELRFACELRDARQLGALLRIHHFLADGGRARPCVPIKERSVELFGQEKRLDTLKDSSLFAPGRLTLETLRCFVVPPPLVWELAPSNAVLRPLLILENHGTFHSFARWNRNAGAYAAVIYGAGDVFKTLAPSLVSSVSTMAWDNRTFYFGDLDAEGLIIPVVACVAFRSAGLSEPMPHVGCYRQLLSYAGHPGLSKAGYTIELPPGAADWLGEALAAEVGNCLRDGLRLPQELVGWETLARMDSTFALPLWA